MDFMGKIVVQKWNKKSKVKPIPWLDLLALAPEPAWRIGGLR